jgi:hypothetical protein
VHHQDLKLFSSNGGAKLSRVAGAPISPAPTLSAISFSISEGLTLQNVHSFIFCNAEEDLSYSPRNLQPNGFLVELAEFLLVL